MDFDAIKQLVNEVLCRMGFSEELRDIEIHQGVATRLSVWIHGQDGRSAEGLECFPTNILIGEKGANLDALEHLVKRIVRHRNHDAQKFTLDINDYRVKRLDDLKQDVKTAAKEVRLYQREVALRPMSSFERRIVHLLLAEYPDIATESVGLEPNRMVVIKPYP